MLSQSRHVITKDRSIDQGNVYDGMEPFVPNWRDPAVLHLKRPRGPDRLSGKTFLRL